MPIYEYACMECESHFEELVRSERAGVACPECGAGERPQAALRPSPSTARPSQPTFGGGGGGGCCGGSCGSWLVDPSAPIVDSPP